MAGNDWYAPGRSWIGKRVKVVRGNKVPVGTEGTVFWYGPGRTYGYSRMVPMRVGFKPDGGEAIWINAGYVEEVEPAATEVDGMYRNWGMEAI